MSKELIEQLAKEVGIDFYAQTEEGLNVAFVDETQLEAFAKVYQAAAPIDNVRGLTKVFAYHHGIASEKRAYAAKYYKMTGFGYEVDKANEIASEHEAYAATLKALIPSTQAPEVKK